jgi:signal transduction histidine kinase/ActR/RegA family two-component response regulator
MTAVHPDDRQSVAQSLGQTARTKQPYVLDYRVVLPDGAIRHLRGVGRPVQNADGVVDEFIGTTTDVSDRVQAQAALLARQQMLDLAQKAAQAVPFEWLIGAGASEDAGSGAADLWGEGSPNEVRPAGSWRAQAHPEDWPILERAIARAAVDSGDFSAEYRAPDTGRTIRWLQAKGHMFFDQSGVPTRIVGFLLDATERHLAAEELKRLEARLRRTRHLEAIGTLAGGVAHDFNNILGAILGYGEKALSYSTAGSKVHHAVENIVVAGERGRALVNRILAFSRSGAGERVAVHVEGVVREALDLIISQLPSGIVIETALQAGRSAIRGDPTQVHQVLMNLATNAIFAMPAGGTLRISLSAICVDAPRIAMIGLVELGDYVVLEVADTGAGIDPDLVERIFDPFVTTKEVGVGTGLGLALVHGIVTDFGGAIDVETQVGMGSRFTVYIPRSGEVNEPIKSDWQDAPRGRGQNVLVVDDEEALARLVEQNLLDLGYRPEAYVSSEAALGAFTHHPQKYHAVISDERMPSLTGLAMLRQMRDISPSIATILLSGYVNADLIKRAGVAGVDHVGRKPISGLALALALARVLEIRSSGRDST